MTPDCQITPAEEAGTTTLALGGLSLALCWLYPLGACFGAVGIVLGVFALFAGGSTRAPLGSFLSVCGTAAGLLINWLPQAWFLVG